MITYKELMAMPVEAGEDEYLKYRAMRRRKGVFGGNGEGGPIGESTEVEEIQETEDVDEALSMATRLKKSRQMKKYSSRMALGRKRAANKTANPERLKKRSYKQARMQFFKKLSKGIAPSELTPMRRAEIEKRLDKMKPRIHKVAQKLIPKARQMEKERKRSHTSNDNK